MAEVERVVVLKSGEERDFGDGAPVEGRSDEGIQFEDVADAEEELNGAASVDRHTGEQTGVKNKTITYKRTPASLVAQWVYVDHKRANTT